jgi:antitoxin HicB
MKNVHRGSSFDDFLEKEGLRSGAEAVAIKRAIAYQIELEMKKAKMTKSELTVRMRTSRSALDRLLDPSNASVTLQTLERAARALGKDLQIKLA